MTMLLVVQIGANTAADPSSKPERIHFFKVVVALKYLEVQ